MYCENCGSRINDEAVFCPVCGERVMHRQETPQIVEENDQTVAFEQENTWAGVQIPEQSVDNDINMQEPMQVPIESQPQDTWDDYEQDESDFQDEYQAPEDVYEQQEEEEEEEEEEGTGKLEQENNVPQSDTKSLLDKIGQVLSNPERRLFLLRILGIAVALLLLLFVLLFAWKKITGKPADKPSSSAVSEVDDPQQTPVPTETPQPGDSATSFDGSESPKIDDFNWFGNVDFDSFSAVNDIAKINGSWKAKLLYPGGEAYDLCNIFIYGYSPDSVYAVLHYDRYVYPLEGSEDNLGVMEYEEIREVQLYGKLEDGQLSLGNAEPMEAFVERFVTDGRHQYATGKISAPQYTDAEFMLVRP